MKITNSTQSGLATAPRSLLRKMSPMIPNRHMNPANRKNSNRAIRNDPLVLNLDQPVNERLTGTVRVSVAS